MPRLLTIILALLYAIPALADAEENRLRALVQRLAPADQETLSKVKYAGHYKLGQLVTYSNRDGRFVAAFHLPAELVNQFTDPAPLIISIEASPHLWTLSRRKAGTLDEGLSMITLTCYAPEDKGPFNRYAVSSDGQNVMVSGVQMYGHPATQQVFSMNQGERVLHLAWRLADDRMMSKKLDVADLPQIPVRVPGLQERYLMPILRRLGPGRPAVDVYRVFDQIPPDSKVVEQIQPLLSKIDSDESADRDTAAAAIKAMGAPALLACMRLDRSTLSPEQKNRIDAFCASDGWVHLSDFEAARRDVDFLAACLDDENPAVRSAAANLLAALQISRQFK
jgi:hypothetical protein